MAKRKNGKGKGKRSKRPLAKGSKSHALRNYLATQELFLNEARGTAEALSLTTQGVISRGTEPPCDASSKLWARMRSARIFEIGSTYPALYHAVDVYVTEKIGGAPWVPLGTLAGEDGTGPDHGFVQRIMEAGQDIAFPDRLPFDHCYFNFGPGVVLQQHQLVYRRVPQEVLTKLTISHGTLVGWLVSHDGLFVEFLKLHSPVSPQTGKVIIEPDGTRVPWEAWTWLAGHQPDGEQLFESGISIPAQRHGITHEGEELVGLGTLVGQGWRAPYSLNPWMLQAVIAAINDHRTFIVQRRPNMNQRYDLRSFAKTMTHRELRKPVPKPYYEFELQSKLLDDSVRRTLHAASSRTWKLQHRCDVRGHERVFMQRGVLPISPKEHAKLTKAEYRIYTFGQLSAEDYSRLMERGIAPKRAHEWIAIKHRWVESYIKGPPDGPYIPAIRRVPTNVRAANDALRHDDTEAA